MRLFHYLYQNHSEFWLLCEEHMQLVLWALSIALFIGVPFGTFAARNRFFRQPLLALVNVFQTIPSLALFGFLLPVPLIGGLGSRSAITALVLYSLLPIVRSALTGIDEVPHKVREAAQSLGMTAWQILWRVELPLALPILFSGIRTAAVLCVGIATIASAIGAGGLGVYIFRGLQSSNQVVILAGALPAAGFALLLDLGFGLCGRLTKTALFYRSWRWFLFSLKGWIWIPLLSLFIVAIAVSSHLWLHNALPSNAQFPRKPLVIGSKSFSEQSVLNELLSQMLREQGVSVKQIFDLKGTLCYQALQQHKIDLYPEYTSTAAADLLHLPFSSDAAHIYQQVAEALKSQHILVSPPLGFRDDFALLMRKEQADELQIRSISQLRTYESKLRLGMGPDFRVRADGYEGFSKKYELRFGQLKELDLNLLYDALLANQVDIIVGNTTDGRIQIKNLVILEDDLHYFAPYEAVFLFTEEAKAQYPELVPILERIGGHLSKEEVAQLNYQVDENKRDLAGLIRQFRAQKGW